MVGIDPQVVLRERKNNDQNKQVIIIFLKKTGAYLNELLILFHQNNF